MSNAMTPVITAKTYDIVMYPIVTEKSTNLGANNQYVFRVAKNATKPEIKNAIEALFKVSVTGVNTLIHKGKTKRFKGRLGQRSDIKKAIVTLKQGDTIDIAVGI